MEITDYTNLNKFSNIVKVYKKKVKNNIKWYFKVLNREDVFYGIFKFTINNYKICTNKGIVKINKKN